MKQEKVYKYSEFIKEDKGDKINQQPQSYVKSALNSLKQKLAKMFAKEEGDEGEIKTFGQAQKEEQEKKFSFKDLNLELQSLDMSTYSKIYDRVDLKFSDEKFLYHFSFTINLEDAVPNGNKEDFTPKKIENCQVIYKKYDIEKNFELVVGPLNKTVKLEDINEEFLINLKIEFDKEAGFDSQTKSDESGFSLETY